MAIQNKQIKDIFTPKIVGVAPNAKIGEAMAIMRDHDISCVVVLDEKKPVGILTERNLVSFAAGRETRDSNIQVRDLMSTPVLCAPKDMDIYDAYNLIFARHIRHLVVVDEDNTAIGIVTLSNIVEHLSYDSFIEMKKVSQVMSKIVYTLGKEVTVQQALLDMSDKAVSCLVVVDKNHPIGILTERDVTRLLVEGQDLGRLQLKDVMSPSVKTVFSDTPLLEAVDLMKKDKLRRLVVVNRQGVVEGLATQTDVVKGLEGKYIERLNRIIAEKEDVILNTSRDLAEKTIYLNNILDSAVDYGIIAVDLNYRIDYFNPGAENLLGILGQEVVGHDVREIQRLNDHTDLFRINEVTKILHEGNRHAYIIKRRTETGKQYISTQASRINDQYGIMIGYLFMFKDVTKRTIAEQLLLQARTDLELRVDKRTKQLADSMKGTIRAMALTVEMRDPYTSGHQYRVADLAAAIARQMGLPADKIEGVFMAGLVHDIGKIRVPSGILCYPGRLSEAEFGIIKPHPETGYEILKGIEFPWPLAEIVLQHHEKLDGSGYPRGLKGNEILLKARILTVADVIEAMSSHRPYRPALGLQLALDEISRNSGIFYDPEVVKASLQVFADQEYQMPSLFKCISDNSDQPPAIKTSAA